MRKSMNLKGILEAKAKVAEGVALGDEVVVGRDDEDAREGVVKVPNGPGDTAGILIDGELEMVPNDEISRKTDETCVDDKGVDQCDEEVNEAWNWDKDEEEEDEVDDAKAKAQERAQARADYADRFGDEASDDYMREEIDTGQATSAQDRRDSNSGDDKFASPEERKAKNAMLAAREGSPAYDEARAEWREFRKARLGRDLNESEMNDAELIEESVMGMSMMPSLARMQALAGISVTEGENPFAKDEDENEQEDDQAEEGETDDTEQAAEEGEADEAAEEGETDALEIAIAVAPEAVEAETNAVEDQADAIEDQADAINAAADAIEPALGVNHPAQSDEVTMMSAPAPVEAFPETEEPEPEPVSLDVCMKALGDLEQQLPNVSVKDFAAISKRLTAIQNSLFEGFSGRRTKITESDIDSYSIEIKDSPKGEKFAVYGWGTYPRHSVLAGQSMKKFIKWYDTEEEAKSAFPDAEIGYRSAHNSFGHLPGENDPVSGGMYPDDI
jgi:hypothetical protein